MVLLSWLQSVAAVALTFGLVVFLHEFGHFILCKRFKVRVERFAFGFGPELWGVTRGETRFSVCAVPLGGFVKPAGENLEEHTGDPAEYFSKPWHQRFLIVAAGPIMNYVLAFGLFAGVIFVRGIPEPSPQAVIGELAAGMPAEAAGLRADDQIVKIGKTDVASWVQMAELIHRSANKPIDVAYRRGETVRHATLTPRLDRAAGQGVIGILPKAEYHPVTLAQASREGIHQCWFWSKITVQTLAQKIRKRERPDLAGPVGIVQMVSRAAHSGLDDLIFMIGLISVAVGFFNLLPIPLLDGGHGALYLWEGLSRRKLTLRTLEVANSVGIVFLVSLFLFVTYSDILRIRDQRRAERAQVSAPAAPGDPKRSSIVSPGTAGSGTVPAAQPRPK